MHTTLILLCSGMIFIAACNIEAPDPYAVGAPCTNEGDRLKGVECRDGRWQKTKVTSFDMPDDSFKMDMLSSNDMMHLKDMLTDGAHDLSDMQGDIPQDFPVDMMVDMTTNMGADMMSDMPQDMPRDTSPDLPPAPKCGDGVINQSTEQCDDGNNSSADGCQETCTVEVGWICLTENTPCLPTCGDGLVVGQETCDDGNQNKDDGCANNCRTEPDWTCINQPSTCTHDRWGNGIIESPEMCDDGNLVAGDGCSKQGMIEDGFICPQANTPCQRVTHLEWDTRTKTPSPYPPETMGNAATAKCLPGGFERGIRSYVQNNGRFNHTGAQCSLAPVNNMGQVTHNPAASQGWFPLPQNGANTTTYCPNDSFLTGINVYRTSDDTEVRGVELLCHQLKVQQGKLIRVGTQLTAQHGEITMNVYTSKCPANKIASEYNGFVSTSYIHRIFLQCMTPGLKTN